MSRSETQAISFRLQADKLHKLEALSAATDRPRSWHIEQALDAYLDLQSWQLEHIQKGFASLDAGRTVSHGEVRDWLMSWGADDEGEPPK
ncbi:MAG: CopG family ribbon-helix-helix protein [Kiloniellales bacterium]|nr:CopG family ribbon-helix-helix protein [Kiloniellales bacterium]